jgi:hypothetical protein
VTKTPPSAFALLHSTRPSVSTANISTAEALARFDRIRATAKLAVLRAEREAHVEPAVAAAVKAKADLEAAKEALRAADLQKSQALSSAEHAPPTRNSVLPWSVTTLSTRNSIGSSGASSTRTEIVFSSVCTSST